MARQLAMKLQSLNTGVKITIIVGILAVIIGVSFFLLLKPRMDTIKMLEVEIGKQEKEIAKNEAKVAKLDELKKRYAELEYSLKLLATQLPEEKEISNLLKQVSDYGTKSGLTITLWKPETKKVHPSGIVYEIPVNVKMTGTYHSLGTFFSTVSGMGRIINITNLSLKKSSKDSVNQLDVTFVAQTFSAIPEEDLQAMAAEAASKGGKKR
ncbi:MAG: type 4a pilus biogenesis protein PilO [bacterium]